MSRGRDRQAWALVRAQYGVVAHRQLVALGLTPKAIKHRLNTGRQHRVRHGVYAVGRRDLSPKGRWMAAVLACGDGAFLTHLSAGALYKICEERPGRIEVGVHAPTAAGAQTCACAAAPPYPARTSAPWTGSRSPRRCEPWSISPPSCRASVWPER